MQTHWKNDIPRKVKMVAPNQDGRQVTKHLGKNLSLSIKLEPYALNRAKV